MIKMCIGIFFARIMDVSLGTLRTFYSVKGKTLTASIVAFFEIFIWFMVAKEALSASTFSLWIALSYSLGYATGTLIGTFIAEKFINGLICVQIITKKENHSLARKIRQNGFGLSVIALENDYDEVKKEMYVIEVSKRSLKYLVSLIKKEDATAFFMINETKVVQNGLVK